jgi:hypothetical protein
MKTYKRIFLLIFLLIIIILLSLFLYRTYRYLSTPQITIFSVIPNNAALIIKGGETKYILDFNKEQKGFFSLLSISQEKKINTVMNAILSKDKYRKLLQNVSFYLSLHIDDQSQEEELLFALETARYYNESLLDFLDLLRDDFDVKTFSYKENIIYALQIDDELLYLNYQNGLLLMTYSETLIRRAINKLVSKDTSIQYLTFPDTRNENAHIHLYIYYRHFIPYLKRKIREAGGDMFVVDMFKSFQCSVFDLTVNKKDILFSGYTTLDISMEKAALFTHKNNELDFYRYLPVNANRIFSIKANKVDDFKKIKPAVQSAEDFFSLMYPTHILSFEMDNDTVTDKYLLIKSGNISETSFHLYNLLVSSFADNHYILDTLQVGTLVIGHIKTANFVVAQLGINNQLPQLEYYVIVDDYIVFTNSKESALTYINALRNRKILKTSTSCQNMDSYFPKEANLFYYYNFLESKQTNAGNLCYQYYENSIRVVRIQFHVQADTILLSNVVFRMK